MKLERQIGLVEGIALVTGGVIGMGVYVLIAPIAAQAGASSWLAIALALIISVIGATPLIHVASAIPAAGGGYLYGSALLHPVVGTLTSYLGILGGAASTCVVAVGLGGYVKPFLPVALPEHLIAIILIALFYLMYLMGLKVVAWLQIAMIIQLILALLTYSLGSYLSGEVTYSFALPDWNTSFIMAIILAFNVCLGFQVIAELGEEMRHAERNIPLSLILGALVIFVVYIGVIMTYVGIVGDNIGDYSSPLIDSGRVLLPPSAIAFISLGAISAGLTSFNAAAIALPREIYSQARSNVLPHFFSELNPKTNSPNHAVTAFFLFVILLITLWQDIDFYGYLAACGIMFLSVFTSLAAIMLPKRFPKLYETAYFKLPRGVLYLLVAISLLSSLALVGLLFMESTTIMAIYVVYIAAIIIYFYARKSWLKANGEEMTDPGAIVKELSNRNRAYHENSG